MPFFTNSVRFHPATRAQHRRNPSNRYVAVEIEIASAARDACISSTVRRWHGSIVQDHSLPAGGFEINTAPASGDVFLAQVSEICAALAESEAHVTKACGLHVHIDARDYDYYAIRRLITLYAKLEPLIFQMVSETRRRSTFCEPCGDRYKNGVGKLEKYKTEREKLAMAIYRTTDTRGQRRDKYNPSRYLALNLHSWYYRGTIECRLFGGTSNAAKIQCWGMMWAAIVDYAAVHTEVEIEALPGGQAGAYQILRSIVGGNGAVMAFIGDRLRAYGTALSQDVLDGQITLPEVA